MDEQTESPWALQLAVRVEKLSPPTTAAACAAAALATIELLDDDRAQPDGIWHAAVSTWNGARIRKLVRRARASAWERAQSVSGVTVARDGAEARAFVPSRMDEAPREITKLQIQSTPLDEVEPIEALPSLSASTLVVAITPRFEMSWGKQAAQSAHAAQRAWMTADDATRTAWDDAGRPCLSFEGLYEIADRLAQDHFGTTAALPSPNHFGTRRIDSAFRVLVRSVRHRASGAVER